MYRLFSDLRILRLALHMEETLERYEEALRDLLPQVPVRARLAPLFEGGPAHERLRAIHGELSAAAARADPVLAPEDVLQTLWECEKAAHEFYVHYLDRLSDPRLVGLFRDLRDEERHHVERVEDAMRLLKSIPRRPQPLARPGP